MEEHLWPKTGGKHRRASQAWKTAAEGWVGKAFARTESVLLMSWASFELT